MNIHSLLAQTYDYSTYTTSTSTDYSSADAGSMIVFWIIYLALAALLLASMAVIFKKAGRKWWEGIIPIYNVYILLKICGRPGWWLVLLLIPFVNIVAGVIIGVITSLDLAKKFGHGIGTALALIFVPFIMYPVMAFSSKYQYQGTAEETPKTIPDTPYPTSSNTSDTTGPQPPAHTDPTPGAPEPPAATPPANPAN